MLEQSARTLELAEHQQRLDVVGLAAVFQEVFPADQLGLLPHPRPCLVGDFIVAVAELDESERRATDRAPEDVERLDHIEDVRQRRSRPLDPPAVGVDQRPIGKGRDHRAPEPELLERRARALKGMLGLIPVAGAELRDREEFDDLRLADGVAVVATELLVHAVAPPRRIEVVDPLEPAEWVLEQSAPRGGLERERFLEQRVLRSPAEHCLGDELVDQRLGEQRRFFPRAEKLDRLVRAAYRPLRIDDDLFHEREQDVGPQGFIVTRLGECMLVIADPCFDRLRVRGERAEQEKHTRSERPAARRLEGPVGERPRAVEIAGDRERAGGAQEPPREILRLPLGCQPTGRLVELRGRLRRTTARSETRPVLDLGRRSLVGVGDAVGEMPSPLLRVGGDVGRAARGAARRREVDADA